MHPKPQTPKIIELIKEIQDKQCEQAIPISKTIVTSTSRPNRGKMQWVPKKRSFKDQVREKVRKNRHKFKVPKEDGI